MAEKSFGVDALFWKRMSKELSRLSAFIEIKKYAYSVHQIIKNIMTNIKRF